MGEIVHRNGDLFHAPRGSYLVHACNCMGRWESGIAKQFAERFPDAYYIYQKFCKDNNPQPGSIKIIVDPEYYIVCLLTSQSDKKMIDPSRLIVEATGRCVSKLKMFIDRDKYVASPKINAGEFKVPWEETEAVIKKYWPGVWNVYTPIE